MKAAQVFHKRYYWDYQQRQAIIMLPVRRMNGETITLDVRGFFVNPKLQELQAFKWLRTVNDALEWVRIAIESQPEVPGQDFWQFPHETLTTRKGDCEDKAILLANLLRTLGVSDWEVRLNAGETSSG